jgi:hypothetical protein
MKMILIDLTMGKLLIIMTPKWYAITITKLDSIKETAESPKITTRKFIRKSGILQTYEKKT